MRDPDDDKWTRTGRWHDRLDHTVRDAGTEPRSVQRRGPVLSSTERAEFSRHAHRSACVARSNACGPVSARLIFIPAAPRSRGVPRVENSLRQRKTRVDFDGGTSSKRRTRESCVAKDSSPAKLRQGRHVGRSSRRRRKHRHDATRGSSRTTATPPQRTGQRWATEEARRRWR